LVSGNEPGKAIARFVHRAACHELADVDRQACVLGRRSRDRPALAIGRSGWLQGSSGVTRRLMVTHERITVRVSARLQSNSSTRQFVDLCAVCCHDCGFAPCYWFFVC
jgi:hypothetical protein